MIKLSNQALLTDLSNIEKSDIKSALTITNPKFSVAMSLGKNVMGISKYTYYFKDTQEGLVIPVGYGISLKDNYLAHHDIEDYRVESPDLLDIEFSGELREYQKGPVDFILGNTNGVIQAPTGTGKTVIAIAAICKRKQPTLILVHTLELANQFVDRLKAFTNIRDVGFIGDTRKIIKPVTVGLLQSVTKMDPTELNKTFGQIFVDETHIIPANTFAAAIARLKAKYKVGFSIHGDSKIFVSINGKTQLTSILEFHKYYQNNKNKEYKVRSFDGNEFCWKKVTNTMEHDCKNKQSFKIKTKFGRELILSEDHSIYKYEDGSIECVAGNELKIGDRILLENYISSDNNNDTLEYRLEYLKNNFKVAGKFEPWINSNIKELSSREPWKIRYERKNGKYGYYCNYREILKKPELLQLAEKIYCSGSNNYLIPKIKVKNIAYILGFFMGDGYVTEGSVGFSVENTRKEQFKKDLNLLRNFASFNIVEKPGNGASVDIIINNSMLANIFKVLTNNEKCRTKKIPNEVYSWSLENKKAFLEGMLASDGHLQISNTSENKKRYVYTTISKDLAYSLAHLLKYFNCVASIHSRNPASSKLTSGRTIVGKHKVYTVGFSYYVLHDKINNYCGQKFKDDYILAKIKEIQPRKEDKLYDITVEGNNFNAFVANDILVHNSATPERTDGLTKIIFWLTGMNHYIVDDTDVKSSIVIPELKVIKTDYFFPIFDSSEYTQMISHLSEDDARNNLILDTYKDYKDRQVVMLCQRQSQVKWLHENIQGSRMLTSKTPKAQRKKIMKELSSGKCKAVISTIQLFSTGIDVPSLDALFICAPVKSKILVKQMAGRIMRPLANKKKPIIIDFYDDKVEILKFQFYNRNRTLKKIIGA